jgi:hypothetical protein
MKMSLSIRISSIAILFSTRKESVFRISSNYSLPHGQQKQQQRRPVLASRYPYQPNTRSPLLQTLQITYGIHQH